jgi:hypothetical protein
MFIFSTPSKSSKNSKSFWQVAIGEFDHVGLPSSSFPGILLFIVFRSL